MALDREQKHQITDHRIAEKEARAEVDRLVAELASAWAHLEAVRATDWRNWPKRRAA